MNTLQKLFIFLSLMILLSITSFGQKTGESTLAPDQTRRIQEDRIVSQERELRQLESITRMPSPVFAVPYSVMERILKEHQLDVPKEYYDKFSVSLKEKDVMMARLSNSNCFGGKTVSVQDAEKCGDAPKFWGGGTYYSFRNKTNYNTKTGVWADIQAVNNKFVAGSKTVQGIITQISDINFDQVKLDSPQLKFLIDYIPAKKDKEIQAQRRLLENGVTSNNFVYSISAPIKLDATYALRSVAYRLKDWKNLADSRTDMLVVFKVVGLEKDGSIILLWKKLKTRKVPTLDD